MAHKNTRRIGINRRRRPKDGPVGHALLVAVRKNGRPLLLRAA